MTRTERATWPEVLTRADLALIYGVSTKSIDRMRAAGALPKPMPGLLRWSKTDVVAWLDHASLRMKGWRVA